MMGFSWQPHNWGHATKPQPHRFPTLMDGSKPRGRVIFSIQKLAGKKPFAAGQGVFLQHETVAAI